MDEGLPPYYILIASNLKKDYGFKSAPRLIHGLLKQDYWLLENKAAHRKDIKARDRVVFYAAGGHSVFIGSAVIKTKPTKLSIKSINISDDLFYRFADPYIINLSNSKIFISPVLAKDVLNELSFVKEANNWGRYFQGSVKNITKKDYTLILRHANELDNIESSADFKEQEGNSDQMLSAKNEGRY